MNYAEIVSSKVIATFPFRFKGVETCDVIVATPISFNFAREILQFVKVSLGINAFDLLGIPGFSKRFLRQSQTVVDSLNLASEKHEVKHIILCQHVDFGESKRFKNQLQEDYHHIGGLISAREKIGQIYPGVKVTLIYARLVNNQTEIEFSEVFEKSQERVRLVTPYRFKGIHYCDSIVIKCLDFRLRAETRACVLDGLGIPAFDIIGLPGSAKSFLEDSGTAWRGIKVACEYHGCKRIVVVQHADCGAYGGSAAFANAEEEEIFHREELQKMKKKILEKYREVEVVMVYARIIADNTQIQFVLVE